MLRRGRGGLLLHVLCRDLWPRIDCERAVEEKEDQDSGCTMLDGEGLQLRMGRRGEGGGRNVFVR